jgi:hypothetical protein
MTQTQQPPSAQIEWVRSVLAIAVAGVGFLAILLFAIYRSLADAETLAGVISGMVGAVLGYYFGSKGVDSAQSNAANQSSMRGKTEAAGDQYQKKVRDLLQKQRDTHPHVYALSKAQLSLDPQAEAVRNTLDELLTLDWREPLRGQ